MALLGVQLSSEAVEFLRILGLLVAFTGELLASVVGLVLVVGEVGGGLYFRSSWSSLVES